MSTAASVTDLDNPLCIRVIPDLANSASRVALSASLERDFRRAPPLERVTSLSVPLLRATSVGTSPPGTEL